MLLGLSAVCMPTKVRQALSPALLQPQTSLVVLLPQNAVCLA